MILRISSSRPNYRVKFSLFGNISQVSGILFQCLVFLFRIRICDSLVAADADQGLQECIFANTILLK